MRDADRSKVDQDSNVPLLGRRWFAASISDLHARRSPVEINIG
jgi:hypothetical protein